MNQDELISFIVEAKKNTYAADGGLQAASSRLGSKDLPYTRGDYTYLDSYYGNLNFCGQEVVWHKEEAIWGMNYHGTTKHFIDTFPAFLFECLKQVTTKNPFRGPSMYTNGEYTYLSSWEGSISQFNGHEVIRHQDKEIYELYFHGGIIRY